MKYVRELSKSLNMINQIRTLLIDSDKKDQVKPCEAPFCNSKQSDSTGHNIEPGEGLEIVNHFLRNYIWNNISHGSRQFKEKSKKDPLCPLCKKKGINDKVNNCHVLWTCENS